MATGGDDPAAAPPVADPTLLDIEALTERILEAMNEQQNTDPPTSTGPANTWHELPPGRGWREYIRKSGIARYARDVWRIPGGGRQHRYRTDIPPMRSPDEYERWKAARAAVRAARNNQGAG